MRLNAMMQVGLALAAVLIQAGCNKDSGATQNAVEPQRTALARGGGARATGTAKPQAKPVTLPEATRATDTAKPQANTVTLPEGTPLNVRTTIALSTKTQ